MGRIQYQFDFNDIEERNSDSELLTYKCPHCTDAEGNFGDIILFKSNQSNLVTNGTCNGQTERCHIVVNFIQTFNCEKMLERQQLELNNNL